MSAASAKEISQWRAAVHACHRFGLSPRPGELAAAARDPRTWLKSQLKPGLAMPAALAGLPSSTAQADYVLRAQRFARDDPQQQQALRQYVNRAFNAEVNARALAGATTDAPFIERWVRFWSNHFTVSVTQDRIRPLAGAFEREAIRPNALGRFRDLLLAAARHPAMLVYLDNAQSIGPDSVAGKRRERGLNENLAREILELHTLGVGGGYGQGDVTDFARVLTGWTVTTPEMAERAGGPPVGAYRFLPATHDPGQKRVLGLSVMDGGEAEGVSVLAMLADHPATARFIATKLARHFIADDPPKSAIGRLENAFRKHDGDLRALALTLIDMPEAWDEALMLAKVKSPDDYVTSILRVGRIDVSGEVVVNTLQTLNQVPFSAPSPAGWPDRAEHWIAAESLLRRVEIARRAGQRVAAGTDPVRLAQWTLGPLLGQDTIQLIADSKEPAEAHALLFAAPEFQRR